VPIDRDVERAIDAMVLPKSGDANVTAVGRMRVAIVQISGQAGSVAMAIAPTAGVQMEIEPMPADLTATALTLGAETEIDPKADAPMANAAVVPKDGRKAALKECADR
jgi:hypothetical protein